MKKCTFLQRLKLFAIFLLVAICLPTTVYSQTSSFTASRNTACTPENIEFTNTSSNPGNDYKWKFGNSNYSDNTGFAPSPVSANYAEPGVYTVWLINETVNDSSSQDINVYPNPNPVLGDPLIGCELLSGSLTVDVTPVVVDPFTIGSGATQSSVGGITGGEPDSVVWDFLGDLPTVGQKLAPGATDATLNLSEVPAGVYDLLFTVFDNHGCQKTTFQQNVIVVYAVPTASYTYSKDDDCGVGSTTFTGTTDADPIGTTYSWEINGSEESTALSFTHNFTAVGDYTVNFTVTNVNGCSSSQSQIISFNTNNTADFSFSGTCVGQATSFTDSSTLASDVLGWEWDFDNNGTVDNTTQNPSHTFSSAGSKTVKLAVTFDDGCVREITKNITITGATASFNYDADGSCAPDYPVDFTSTSSVSGSATITAWAWDFDNDGSTDSNLENPSYDFNNFGTFPVALTLTTSDGCSNADTSNVVVSESKVDFAVTPDNGCASLTSSFVVVSDNTSDPIVSYIWAFGDGDSAFVAAPNHTFDVAGEYTTILTAETNSGCVLTTQKEILVGSVELIDTIIVVPSSDSCLSSAYSFKAAISPLFDSIVWNFSDGSAEVYQTLSSQDTSYITHTFTSPDPNYSVSAQGFYNGCPSPIYTVNNIVVNYPSADFSVTSNSACSVPATVDFTNSSTINPSGATGYLWIFDDPTSGASDTSFLENPTHIYNNTGDYTVHLTVTDSATGCTSEFSEVIYVTTSSVDFVADNTTQCAGILGPVDFTSTVTSSANYSAASYSWDFGDGNTSNAANPTHSYSLPNEYDVALIVTEEHGCTDTMTKLVYMDIEGPIVSFTADASNICVNATVNFTNTSTKAGNDSATPALDSFAWDFGDGSAISNLENPSHAYTAAGTYTVTLTVYDENGCEASNSATGSVAVPNLSAGISADTAVCIGENITFTDNSSGTVTEYAWDLDNDGSFDDGTATSASTSFSTTGIHTVSLRIRNSLGCEDISTKDVLVVDGNGEFTVNPSVIGCAPAMVNFNSTDNPAVVASYSWTFGDGDTSTDDDPGHFYRMPGQYIVTLEETLIGGCTRTSDDTITVAGAYGEFSYTNTPGCIDHPEEYYAIEMTSTDELTWDFGDGITLVESVSVGTDSMSTQHTYTTWGTRLPILILRDSTCGDYAYYYGKDNRINTSEPPIAGIDVVSADDTACVAEIVSFVDTSSIVDPRYQLANWQWDFEDDGTFDAFVQNPTFAFPDSGLYTVRLRVKTEFVNVPGPLNPALDDGCWEEITKEVYVKPIPTVAVANDAQEICSGDESVDMVISSPNDSLATYVWSWSADAEISSSAPVNGVGDTIPGYTFINNSQEVKTVTYSITPTGSEPTTCDGPVATATLIVNPIPIVSSESELSICNGESVDYTITSEVIGTTYKWVATNDVGTVLGFSSDTTATDSVISDVLSNAGNADGLVTYVITPIGPAPTYCVGPNFWLEVNVLNCEPMIGVAKQLVSTDYNEDGTAEVLFNIRVQNYGNVFLDSIQIVEDLDATFGVDNYEVLGISSTGFDVNTNFDGSSDFNLLSNSGTVNTLAVDASTDIRLRIKVLSPNSYTNQVVASSTTGDVEDDSQDGSDPDPDGDGDPTDNDELTPIVIGSCTLSANVTQNSTCGNAEGIVQLSTGNAGDEITLNGVVRVSPATYTNLQAGHYKARSISATTGCIAVANFEITNSNSDLSASVTEHMDVTCFGGDDGEIEITAYGVTSPYDYTLIDSMQSVETNQTGSFSSLKMGEYSVKVEDNNGCTYIVSFDIDEPTALFAEIVNSSDVSCNGGNNGKAMVNVTGGTAPYTYSWNDASSQTSALATGLLAASYIVTVTDANNCTTTANVTIDEPASALSISGYTETNPTCFDANNGSINITVAGGTSPYNFVWSNGQASEDASSLTAGSFSVTVTDANGCSTSGSYSLTNPTEVSISVGTIVNTNCNDSVGSVVLTSSDASTITLNGVTQASGSTFTGLGAGYYVATSNGTCSASTGFNITNSNSDLSGTVSYHKNVSCNGGNDGEATVTFSGGQTPYTIELNGISETDAVFTNLIAGEYGAKVTDANGCTYTVSFDIDEPTVLVASIVNITDESCGGGSDGTITVTASGGTTPYSYLWSDGQTTGTATGLASGRYDVTITDANGCIALASDSVGIAECQLVLVDDNETTPEDMPLYDSVLANDSDPSGGTLVVTQFVVGNDTTIVPLGGTGSYTISGIGVIEMDPNGVYTFTPEVDYNGDVPEITYTASNGIIEDEATLNITILPLDDLVAEDDNITTPEDSTATGDVTANDIDPNGSPLWVTQFVIGGDTTFVTATTPGVANIPGIGEITIDSLGSYTFVPEPGYSGDVPEIVYTVTNGSETDQAEINITLTPNDDLLAVNDNLVGEEDSTLTSNVLVNDVDPNGNPIWVTEFVIGGDTTLVDALSGGTDTIPGIGIVSIDSLGNLEFVPEPGYSGDVPEIVYTVTNGTETDQAEINITLTPNDDLLAVNDNLVGEEDSTITSNVLVNDVDPNGNPIWVTEFVIGGDTTLVDALSGGTDTIPGIGIVSIDSLGNLEFVPEPGYSGDVPEIVYTVTNGTETDQAEINITLTPNDDLAAVNDNVSTPEDVPVSGNVTDNDFDPNGEVLTVTQFVISGDTVPVNLGSSSTYAIPEVGELEIDANGNYTFTPVANFYGDIPEVVYTVINGSGESDTAELNITVLPVNDLPVALSDVAGTAEDTPVSGDLSVNDTISGDGGNIWTIDTDPTRGTVTIHNDGTFTYIPTADSVGLDSFIYKLCDVNGDCDTAIVYITVTEVNDDPVAVDDFISTLEDTPVQIPVVSNDNFGGDGPSIGEITITNPPVNGTATVNNNGTPDDPTDDFVDYVPNEDFEGNDSFEYEICDSNGDCDQAIAVINVNSVNDLPIAVTDSVTGTEDTPITGTVIVNDTISGDGGNIWNVSEQPENGSVAVNSDGTYIYTPEADFNGIDSFAYKLCDVNGDCDTAYVIVTVEPVNDPPIVENDNLETDEDTPVTYNIITNDSDIDGNIDPGTIDLDPSTPELDITYTVPGEGVYEVDTITGILTFTPDSNFYGETTPLTYQVCDDGTPLPAECGTAAIVVNVLPVNDPPIAGVDTMDTQLNPGGTNTVTVLANEFSGTDVDGTISFVRITTMPLGATSITVDGVLYTSIPASGIDVATTPEGQPLFAIEVDPMDGVSEVNLEYFVVDNEGLVSVAAGSVTIPFESISITGSVFNDDDGLLDNTVDGTGTNEGGSLYMNLVNMMNEVVASVAVVSDGSYSFTETDGLTANETFNLILSDGVQTVGSTLAEASYPDGLQSVGENIGSGAGDDGTVDGILTINTNNGSLADLNFGVAPVMILSEVIVTDANCDSNEDGAVQLGVTSGNIGVVTYELSTGESNTSGLFEGLAAGGYIYTATDEDGYSVTGSFFVDDPNELELTVLEENDDTCYNASTGSARVVASGGTLPYQFDWNGVIVPTIDDSISVAEALPAGIYVVTVTDANGCIEIETLEIEQPDSLDIQVIDDIHPDCDNSGQLILSGTGGTPPYTYSSLEGGVVVDNRIVNLTSGTYTLTITDFNNCQNSITVEISDIDVSDPEFTCPPTQYLYADENCQGAVPDLTAMVTDAIDNCTLTENLIITQSLAADTLISSDLSVTVTVSDTSGNSSECEVYLIFQDTTPPEATCNPITLQLDMTGYAHFGPDDIDSASYDNCGISAMWLDVTSFDCTSLGANPVTLTVRDDWGNMSTCEDTVYIIDNVDPILDCPAPVILSADENCSALVPDFVEALSNNNCDVAKITQEPLAYEPIPLGDTIVTIIATDSSGNADTCFTTVTVIDDTPPTFTAPETQILYADENCQYTVPDLVAMVDDFVDNCSQVDSLRQNISAGEIINSDISVTITAVDTAGNETSKDVLLVVTDITPPVAQCNSITLQLDMTGYAHFGPEDIDSASYDNCGIMTMALDVTTFDCTNLGANPVLLTVTDNWENTSTCVDTVYIIDNVDPVLDCPAPVTLSADENCSAPIPDFADALSNNNCGEAKITQDPVAGTLKSLGDHVVKIIATDESGNIDTCLTRVTIIDDTAPTFICPPTNMLNANYNCQSRVPDLTAQVRNLWDNCGTPIVTQSIGVNTIFSGDITVTVTATDDSGNHTSCDVLVQTIDNEDPVAQCRDIVRYLDMTGRVSINAEDIDRGSYDNCGISDLSLNKRDFDCTDIGERTVILTVTDDAGNWSRCSATVTILDNIAPIIDCPAPVTLTASANCSARVPNLTTDVLMQNNCGSATITQSPEAGTLITLGVTDVRIKAVDGSGNVTTCTTTVTVIDETAPTFTCPSTQTLPSGENCEVEIPDLLALVSDVQDNCGEVSSFTQSIQAGTTISSNITVTLSAIDFAGNETVCDVLLELIDTTAPTAICKDLTLPLDMTGTVLISAEDVDNGSTDNCGLVSIEIDVDQFTCEDVGENEVILTVSDGSENSSTCTAIVTIEDNIAPILDCPSPVILVADENCEALVPDFTEAHSTINCGTAIITQVPEAGSSISGGVTEVVITAVDGSGNVTTCTTTVTVIDETAPTFTCPSTQTLPSGENCEVEIPDLLALVSDVQDNCGEVSSFTQSIQAGTTISSNITVTLTAIDFAGNETVCDVLLELIDTTAPTAICKDLTLPLNMTGTVLISAEDVDNGSTDNCGLVSIEIDVDQFTCEDVGENEVILTVSDGSGNSSKCTAKVTIEDNIAPILDCPSPVILVADENCEALVPDYIEAHSTINCGTAIITQVPEAGSSISGGVTEVVITATDGSGNVTTCTTTVTVIDETAPTMVCPIDRVVYANPGECSANLNLSLPLAYDNCSEDLTYYIIRTNDDGTSSEYQEYSGGAVEFQVGVNTIEWIVVDQEGYQSRPCWQNVIVEPDVDALKPDAGASAEICEFNVFTTVATAPSYANVIWSTSGTGEFDNPTSINTIYTPSQNDIDDGVVILTVTSYTECAEASDQMVLRISKQPKVSAGADASICEGDGYLLSSAMATGVSTVSWISSGSGTFSNPDSYSPFYIPSEADIEVGSVELILRGITENSCEESLDTMMLFIDRLPVVVAGEEAWICENESFVLADASIDYGSDYSWTTSGTGTFDDVSALHAVYSPSLADILDGQIVLTLTHARNGLCDEVSDNITLHISHQLDVSAGEDASICEDGTYHVHGSILNKPADLLWTSSGTGTFDNAAFEDAVYTPSAADIETGMVELVLTAFSSTACPDDADTIILSIERLPIVTAGDDAWICETETFELSKASLQYGGQVQWSTNGSGTFDDKTAVNTVYNPSSADVMNGSVTLTISITPDGVCDVISDELTLKFSKTPSVEAGENRITCFNQDIQITGAAAANYETLMWTTNGVGTILNAESLSPTYVPGEEEVDEVTMTLTITAEPGCGSVTISDQMVIDIKLPLIVDIGDDETIFGNSSTELAADVVNGTGSYFFTWEPTNMVLNPNSSYTKTIDLLGTTIFEVTVVDVKTGCRAVDSKTVSIEDDAEGLIGFYRGFSPNSDGVNDTWSIRGIDKFPLNKVMIFNRWGDKVKELYNYNNTSVTWDGTNKKGDRLPDGTYYYLVELTNVKEFTGWVHIRTDR